MLKTRHNRCRTVVRAIVLVNAASLPRGYMLGRSENNVLEILICNELGENAYLYLDTASGEYKEPEGGFDAPIKHHDHNGAGAACHMSGVKLAGPDLTFAISFLYLKPRTAAQHILLTDPRSL